MLLISSLIISFSVAVSLFFCLDMLQDFIFPGRKRRVQVSLILSVMAIIGVFIEKYFFNAVAVVIYADIIIVFLTIMTVLYLVRYFAKKR